MNEQELAQKMIEAGLHIGVRKFLVHPKMKNYVFTFKDDLALINLAKTQQLWDKFFKTLDSLIADGKTILFLGTQPAAKKTVAEKGKELGFPYMTKLWLGGTLTNFSTFKERLEKLRELEEKIASTDFSKYTKKEQGQLQKEADEIKDKFDGLVGLKDLPDLLLVFCGRKHRTALTEAKRTGIPVAGVFGLDDNPDEAEHLLVINDNSRPAIEMVMEEVAKVYNKYAAKQETVEAKPAPAKSDSAEVVQPVPAEK